MHVDPSDMTPATVHVTPSLADRIEREAVAYLAAETIVANARGTLAALDAGQIGRAQAASELIGVYSGADREGVTAIIMTNFPW